MNDYSIGEIIKKIMNSRHISPIEMASKLDITREAVYSILRKKDINTELLKRIANALEVDFKEFFGCGSKEFEALEAVLRIEKEKNSSLLSMISEFIQFVFSNTYYKELINKYTEPTDFIGLQQTITRRIEIKSCKLHGFYIPLNYDTVIKIINYTLFEIPAISEAFEKKKIINKVLLVQYEEWKNTTEDDRFLFLKH